MAKMAPRTKNTSCLYEAAYAKTERAIQNLWHYEKTVMVRYRLATFSIKESNKKIWNLKTNKLMMSDITEDITYDSSCHLNPPTQVKSTLRLSQVLYIK